MRISGSFKKEIISYNITIDHNGSKNPHGNGKNAMDSYVQIGDVS